MARYRGKKAFYEVISKTKFKPGYGRGVEELHPEDSAKKDEPTTKSAVPTPEWTSQWRRRPKIVQFNAGRIELSMPYQLAIAILLGIVLLVLFAFRIGEYSSRSSQKPAGEGLKTMKSGEGRTLPLTGKQPGSTDAAPKGLGVWAKAQGDHRIVIQQYHKSRDLVPVQGHFLAFGIETVIEKRGVQYFLVTKDTYENPERKGTDGAAAKQRIIERGAEYKAQTGYESFAPKLFSDAYGEKIKK
jgi:hypothetical protein